MPAKRPTLPEFKRFCKDVAPAAKAVLMARVHAELERERVNAYILPLFREWAPFKVRADWAERLGETIDTPDRLYLCDDEPYIAAYFEACDKAHREHGFTGPKGHCPALVADHLLMVTEQALIDLAKPLFGIDHVYGDDRKRYLELLIGACIKAESEAA